MATNIVSGAVRITNTSTVYTRTFSAAVTTSNFNVQDYVIANGVSNFIVSLAAQSSPGFLMMMATSTVRANFGGHASADSAASLGFEFKDLYARIGSGISGDINIHLANSSGDSATVTIIQGM